MFITVLATAVLPLVAIKADDDRLDSKRTYVSAEAKQLLTSEPDAEIYCIDRPGNHAICLVKSQWAEAVARANAGQGRKGPRQFPLHDESYRSPSTFGLASSPSTFTGP